MDMRKDAENSDTVGMFLVRWSLGLVHDMKMERGRMMNKLIYKTSLSAISVPT
jgi:hypothetical protein